MYSLPFFSQLKENLQKLYGDDGTHKIISEIIRLRNDNKIATKKFDNLDGPILVAYPGNVYEHGQPDLLSLNESISDWLPNPFQALHLLPFYPSTSDFGFAPFNHLEVDPKFGKWSNVRALACKGRLMADLVMHHTSAQHQWFYKFLNDEPYYRDFYTTVQDPSDFLMAMSGRQVKMITSFDTRTGVKHVFTRYGVDQIDLNYRNPNVLIELMKIMAKITNQGVSSIRLDAIAYAWKEPHSNCIHLEQTACLFTILRIVAASLNPDIAIVPEIDIEYYGKHYLNEEIDTPVAGYSYAFAPLLISACLNGKVTNLANFLEADNGNGNQKIRFLSTHDGLFLRPYAPVLSVDEEDLLSRAATKAGGWIARRHTDKRVYELNAPVLDILRGSDSFGEDRAIAALFILLSVPGIPAIFLNLLIGAPPNNLGVAKSGDPRAIGRGVLLKSEITTLISKRQFHITRWINLLKIRRSEPTLNAKASLKIVHARNGLLIIMRKINDRKLIALVNLEKDTVIVPISFEGISLINGCHTTPHTLGPYKFDWIIL